MPHRISRERVLERLTAEAPSACWMCVLARPEDRALCLAHTDRATVRLSRYPTRWGHVLVIPRAHVERFEALDEDTWLEATKLAHRAARALERVLRPSRCYVASLGTSEPELPMTFPHLHVHVIPVDEPGARPSEVLTWQHGLYDGTDDEWRELHAALVAAWRASPPATE